MNINIIKHGTGNPLVLFHGWGFDVQVWDPILPLLTNRYQLYLVDLPGFGLTPPMEWEAFKAELIKQLPQCFAVAGWSMGGLFATRLAIEEPQRVTHLVNIASSPRFIREQNWPGIDRQIINLFYDDLADNPQRTLQQFIELQLQGQTVSPSPIGQAPTLMGLRAGLDLLVHWDLRNDLNLLKTPVYYMFGRLDTITPRMIMSRMQTLYPHFNYILFPKAAHAPFLSHPDQFITALEDFLQ